MGLGRMLIWGGEKLLSGLQRDLLSHQLLLSESGKGLNPLSLELRLWLEFGPLRIILGRGLLIFFSHFFFLFISFSFFFLLLFFWLAHSGLHFYILSTKYETVRKGIITMSDER